MNNIYSALTIYENPDTKEMASLFIHNIKCTIVTNDITISCNSNKAHKILENMNFTKLIAKESI